MPIPLILGAAAAAVVTVSYLVPLIISCIGGGITIIVTFIATRAYYKNKNEKDVEMQNLKKQQIERDNAIREEVSKIAIETGIDMQILLKLSREQQEELKRTIQVFMQNIDDSDAATKSLTVIANTIQEATNNADMQNMTLHKELEQIKNELIHVYEKLSTTEKNLAQKEGELQKTIDKLDSFGEQITTSGILEQLEYFEKSSQESSDNSQNYELQSLKAKNITLAETIAALDKTIATLQRRLDKFSEIEKLQIQEIQNLISDNKLLTETIESLTESIELQNTKATKVTQNTFGQLRIFR